MSAFPRKVTFETASKGDESLHHVIAFPINRGKTIADVRRAFTARNPSGPPPVDFSAFTGRRSSMPAARLSPMGFRPGSYVLLCFLDDRDDTTPHFMKGLLTKIDIT